MESNEIYLVQAEYLNKKECMMMTSQCGASFIYDKAKELCENVVKEDCHEYGINEDSGWLDKYHDDWIYEDESRRINIYVCTVDII